ncbi:putative Ras GTPase-activating protein-binding protein [Helianthus annuus]|nr:putative Ras GTPase-activating protein-binding protein [Helianthus annuus]KAJ0849563.1 putative Ras GTPase-activating protein-binding protein [Helianthus annuus]
MLQIHVLVMSLNYTGIEIKIVHALESWDRGVVVLVSASSYMSGSDIHARDFVQPAAVVENGTANNYGFQEQQLQALVAESILEDSYPVQTNGSVQNSVNALQNHMTPVEEVVEEPQKHTYASILQVAKGHSAPSAPTEQSFKKSTSVSELNHVSESPAQQFAATLTEAVEDPSVVDWCVCVCVFGFSC